MAIALRAQSRRTNSSSSSGPPGTRPLPPDHRRTLSRETELLVEFGEEIHTHLLGAVRPAAEEALEELGGAHWRAHLPAHPGGTLCRHLMWCAGGDLEALP